MLTRRELIGFSLAPGSVPALLALIGSLGWAFGAPQHIWSHALGSAVMVAIYAYIATLILALPIYGLMRTRNWLRWWHCVASGVVVGVLAAALFLPVLGVFVLALLPAFVGVGAVSALVYWLLARRDLRSNFSSSGRATSARRST